MARTQADFLQAKRRLDSHSHHAPTWARFRVELTTLPQEQPLRILEPGCGTGTMLEHLLALPELKNARLDAFDSDPGLIDTAQGLVESRAADAGFRVEWEGERALLQKGERTLSIHYRKADLYDLLASPSAHDSCDILLTHAFLDLFPIPTILPGLLCLVRTGGLLFALLTFDGGTRFDPEFDMALDRQVVELYQRSMVRSDRNGQLFWGFEAGQDLMLGLLKAGAEVLSQGPSDWHVEPGNPLGDEEYALFLHTILDYVEREVGGESEIHSGRFAAWMQERRRQVEEGILSFHARNIDVLARV